MRYTPDQFLALMEVVEAQGGVHLVDPCKPGEYFLDREDYRGNLKKRKFYTAGCNRAARFLVPYTSDIDEAEHMLDVRRHNVFKLKIGAKALDADIRHVAAIKKA